MFTQLAHRLRFNGTALIAPGAAHEGQDLGDLLIRQLLTEGGHVIGVRHTGGHDTLRTVEGDVDSRCILFGQCGGGSGQRRHPFRLTLAVQTMA
ncbi:hypothetical protein D3C81_1819200 [compost metagenome]